MISGLCIDSNLLLGGLIEAPPQTFQLFQPADSRLAVDLNLLFAGKRLAILPGHLRFP
jgi:hypothetical protein